MNDTETKNTAVKAPALMSTRPVTAQDALDQCEKLSPMMVHYCQTKTGLTDPANTILFYRLGDFYEMFFEDATLVSKELELTLTGKDCGMEERAPMCGIPYHAAEGYINRLVENGHKVAICEQMEDPALAKGLVDRDIIRIITPGTVMTSSMLEEGRNNFICAVYRDSAGTGLCFCDISTGECSVTSFTGPEADEHLYNELGRFTPREAMLSDGAYSDGALVDFLVKRLDCRCENGGEARFRLDAARTAAEKQFSAGLDALPAGAPVVDLIYAPAETELLRRAREGGHQTANGFGLLVNQAVLSLEHFTGTAIDAAEMKRRLADVLLP